MLSIFRNSCLIILLGITVLLQSCNEETQQSLKVLPVAFGDQNGLTIICDKNIWEGPVGDTIDYYYSSPYLILPQPEPILDLKHFTPAELRTDPLRKELRIYLIAANLQDSESPTTQFVKSQIGPDRFERALYDPKMSLVQVKDPWAKGQLVMYQFAKSETELIDNLKKNFPLILEKINQHDYPKLEATVYLDERNAEVEQEIRDKVGVDMRIPKGFVTAINDDRILWIRNESDNVSSNVILNIRPYTDAGQLSRKNILAIRDSIGKDYISTRIEGTYMKVNDEDLPVFTKTTRMDNKYAIEARGIWEIENDYMGGPFVSYLIHNPKKNELIFMDGFIHAPGEDKRNHMQYLEHVLNTIKIP